MYLLNVFSVAIAVSLVSADKSSPVLLWSPERSMVDLPDVSDVDSFSASDFYSLYLAPLMHEGKENAVVFLQDKLSVDDFTKYADVFSKDSEGGAFKNIKRLLDDHFSLELPDVDSPHTAVDKLRDSFGGSVHIINHPAQLEPLNLRSGKKFLLIVNLHPIIGSGDVEKAISQNDAMIGDITQHLLNKAIKYSALFTGKSAADAAVEESLDVNTRHNGRHLLATNEDEPLACSFRNVSSEGGDIFVYLCGIDVCIKDKDVKDPSKCVVHLNKTLVDTDDVSGTSQKKNNTARINLKFDNLKDSVSGDEYNVEVSIDVSKQLDRWTMDRFSLNLEPSKTGQGNLTLANATLVDRGLDTIVPLLYSFHCTQLQLNLETLRAANLSKNQGSFVILEKFQFQAFDIPKGHFFNAQDCVGFFTAGIWMGIVPALLLIGILLYGTLMVLNLSVMDKFDNPKGKTISVNNAE